MPKHRWRESFKSFFGSHIDPEKDEELKGTRAEMESKVQQILTALKEDNTEGKEPLINLITDFHNHYQSLYDRYDHLIDELQKKATSNKGDDSSSSSSDSSDSENSPKKMGKMNGKVEKEFDNDMISVKKELELVLFEVGDLRRKLTITLEEKETLARECERAFSKIEEAEKIILSLNGEAKKFKTEKSRLLAENEDLVKELESLRKSRVEERESESLTRITELTAEVNSLLELLGSLVAQKSEADIGLEKKSGEISEFLIQIEQLKEELSAKSVDGEKLLQDKENIMAQLKELQLQLETLFRQKDDLEIQLREEKTGLENKISESEKYLTERDDKVNAVERKLEDVKNEASAEIAALKIQHDSLQQKLGSLLSEKTQLETQIERSRQESAESLALAEHINTELVNKITEHERKLKEKEDELFILLEDHKKLEAQLQNCQANLKSSEKKIEELTQHLENEVETKDQELVQLEENIEDLKRDLEMKDDEINTMLENMRNIEVKQRLTSQKLRVTEQLLSEKDESCLQKEKKLLEEHKSLQEKALVLSDIITIYKEAHTRIALEISEKLNDTLAGFDAFHVKFEEDYGHLESRVYEIVNELKAATSCIKKKIVDLGRELSEEKDNGLVLEGKIDEQETKLQNNENERRSLVQTLRQREEKVGELEKKIEELERKMKEKEMGFLNLSEEKREAIRQLSVSIEYHHNRYNDLKAMLAKPRGGTRQLAG